MSWQVVNLRPLGSGGNGDLFVGRRSDNGDQVVVKYLREYHSADARNAFAREARILARGLPGLVSLLFADMNVAPPYYVMPYVGGSLTRYAGRLTESQLHAVAADVGRTLAVLHAGYVAHGDIKPDNILVSQDGRLQVADPLGNGVGCTVLFSEHHGGTPGYWAPEVCAGGPISYVADVYSYGATLYELLTGRKPQDGRRLDPGLEGNAQTIRQLITACCQFNPGARPSIQEVFRMLRGEQWADIQVARRQRQGFWTVAACFIGVVLLGAALTADG